MLPSGINAKIFAFSPRTSWLKSRSTSYWITPMSSTGIRVLYFLLVLIRPGSSVSWKIWFLSLCVRQLSFCRIPSFFVFHLGCRNSQNRSLHHFRSRPWSMADVSFSFFLGWKLFELCPWISFNLFITLRPKVNTIKHLDFKFYNITYTYHVG